MTAAPARDRQPIKCQRKKFAMCELAHRRSENWLSRSNTKRSERPCDKHRAGGRIRIDDARAATEK